MNIRHSHPARIGTIHEDVTTDVLGVIGAWQWHVTMISTTLMLLSFSNQDNDIFLLKPSTFIYCLPPDGVEVVNISLCSYRIQNGSGTIDVPCNKWRSRLLWVAWVEKSWTVFCDQNNMLSTALISRAGMVFGSVILGLVADSFGRRRAILLDVYAEILWGLVLAFVSTESWFKLFVFLRSMCGCANCFVAIILVCEIASNNWRSWLSTIVIIPRLLSMVCIVPLANCFPSPETYSCIWCVFAVGVLLVARWTPESPQWLLFDQKIHTAEVLLLTAAAKNGVKFSASFKIRPVNHRAYISLDETTTFITVLTTRNVRTMISLTFVHWILYNFLWSTLYQKVYIGDIRAILPGSLCLFVVFGIASMALSKKLQFNVLMFTSVILTGVFTVGVVLFQGETIRDIMSSIALASGLIFYAITFNITNRFFGVHVRGTLVGCCYALGEVGSLISYVTFLFHIVDDRACIGIVIVVTLVLAVLCFLLPNVDGRELPDTLTDMDFFAELSKPLRWATQKTRSVSAEEIELRVYSYGSAHVDSFSNSLDLQPARPITIICIWLWITGFIHRLIDFLDSYSRHLPILATVPVAVGILGNPILANVNTLLGIPARPRFRDFVIIQLVSKLLVFRF